MGCASDITIVLSRLRRALETRVEPQRDTWKTKPLGGTASTKFSRRRSSPIPVVTSPSLSSSLTLFTVWKKKGSRKSIVLKSRHFITGILLPNSILTGAQFLSFSQLCEKFRRDGSGFMGKE